MAEMEATQRAAIFELRGRTPPVPYAKIADQLGISESQVYREHKRQAPNGRNGGEAAPAVSRRTVTSEKSDPELDAAEKRVDVLRLTLQEHELQRRLALLDGKAGGQETAMGPLVSLLSEQMRRMEENFDRRLTLAQPTRPAEDPMAAMVNGMSMLAKVQQQAQLLAPPAPVSAGASIGDLEARVAMERIRIESEALTRKATSEAERNAFIMSTAKENLPLILGGLQKFFENIGKREEPPARPQLHVLEGRTIAENEATTDVPMTCAACKSKFMVNPEPGEIPTCTVCGGPLQVESAPATPKPAWPEDATFG